jgi:anti-sigma factor RsiW
LFVPSVSFVIFVANGNTKQISPTYTGEPCRDPGYEDKRKTVVHLTQKQIEDYSRHQLSPADVLAVADHLGECEVCRAQIEVVGNGDAAFFGLRSQVFEEALDGGVHLTMDQTAAYVDHRLSGEELLAIDDHLMHCEACVLAVDDLREFRNEIAPSLDREYQPAGLPSRAATPARGWLGSLFAPLRVSPVPAFATAALAILLLSAIAWFVWRKSDKGERQIANAPAPVSHPSTPPQLESTPAPPAPQPVAVVAQLNEGSRGVTLDQEGKLSGADDLPPAYQQLLKKTLGNGRIEKSSQLQGLSRASSSLMGADDPQNKFSVLEPLGNVLLSNRATFRWSAMGGATGYVVEVFDEKFAPVAASPQLTELTWTTTLPRGHVYSWQVKAITTGEEIMSPRPPAPQAKFRVLDQSKATELANARRAYPSSHLTLGLLYADAGLLSEAEQEFRLLQKANPNSELARNLLRQVQALRR